MSIFATVSSQGSKISWATTPPALLLSSPSTPGVQTFFTFPAGSIFIFQISQKQVFGEGTEITSKQALRSNGKDILHLNIVICLQACLECLLIHFMIHQTPCIKGNKTQIQLLIQSESKNYSCQLFTQSLRECSSHGLSRYFLLKRQIVVLIFYVMSRIGPPPSLLPMTLLNPSDGSTTKPSFILHGRGRYLLNTSRHWSLYWQLAGDKINPVFVGLPILVGLRKQEEQKKNRCHIRWK